MSITFDCLSPILKSNISKLLKIRTKSNGINSEVLLVIV